MSVSDSGHDGDDEEQRAGQRPLRLPALHCSVTVPDHH